MEIEFEEWKLSQEEKTVKIVAAHVKYLSLLYMVGFELILYEILIAL